MKVLTYVIAFLIAAFVNTVIKDMDIAYALASLIKPDDISAMAILTGTFSGIFTAANIGLAFYFARKINQNREVNKLKKTADDQGMSLIEHTMKVTKKEVLDKCASINDNKELKHYLEVQTEWGTITDLQAKILFDHYKK